MTFRAPPDGLSRCEFYAIAKGGGTLSTFIRRFFRVSDKTPLKWSWPAWVLYLILAVLVVHFAVP